jgi:hypothetical protein
MTKAEIATVLSTIRSLWPHWKPSVNEVALWSDALQHWGCSTVLLAVQRVHSRGTAKGFAPTMSDLLVIATEIHREENVDPEAEDKRLTFAREAETARQDRQAAQEFIDSHDSATIERAKRWIAEEAVGSPGNDVESFQIKFHLLPMLLKACPAMSVHMLADAIQCRPWERREGIEALGKGTVAASRST